MGLHVGHFRLLLRLRCTTTTIHFSHDISYLIAKKGGRTSATRPREGSAECHYVLLSTTHYCLLCVLSVLVLFSCFCSFFVFVVC